MQQDIVAIARTVNDATRLKAGLTGYVDPDNERSDVMRLAETLVEHRAELISVLEKL
jgi:hypothetical protein